MVWKGFRWARHFIYLTYLPEGKYLITYLLYLFMPNSRRFLAGSFLIFFCPNNRNSSFEVLAERRRRVPTSKMKKKRKEIDAASSIFKSGANKKKPQGGGGGTEEGLKTSSMTTSLMIELCEQSKRLRRADRAEDDDQRVFRSLFSLESLGRKKYKKKRKTIDERIVRKVFVIQNSEWTLFLMVSHVIEFGFLNSSLDWVMSMHFVNHPVLFIKTLFRKERIEKKEKTIDERILPKVFVIQNSEWTLFLMVSYVIEFGFLNSSLK